MNKITRILSTAMLLACTTALHAQKITVTWAGNGSAGSTGNGASARHASIGNPYDVSMNAAGDMFISDQTAGVVRKVSGHNGVISTVAGGGTSTADNILATQAQLSVQYICLDAAGNLYIPSGNRVRKVDATTGVITTYAGQQGIGFAGDGGPAASALFRNISGICMDNAGNMYVVDAGNARIRKIAAGTTIVTTIAGAGTSGYTGDGGNALVAAIDASAAAICVNAAGDLFFSDQSGTRVRGIMATTGEMRAIAGTGSSPYGSGNGGPATAASVGWVHGLCCDGNGDIIVDDDSCACRRINMTSGIINLVAGDMTSEGYNGDGGAATAIWFNWPSGVRIDGTGNVIVADKMNGRVRKVIQLTTTPSFAYGHGQFISACAGNPYALNEELSITDLDASQNETWTVVTPPAHGVLGGFPAVATSGGTVALGIPSAVSYTPMASYAGADSFQVQVSDGALSDIVTIYVSVTAPAGTITGQSSVCAESLIGLNGSIGGGTWSVDNNNASISSSGMLTGLVPGQVTVSYTVAAACGTAPTATTTKLITIDGTPDAGTITTQSQVCTGGTLLCTDAITGGVWSATGNGIIFGTNVLTAGAPGTTTLNYTVTNACGSANASLQITVVPMPDAGLITAADSVCKNGTITVADPATGGVWTMSNGIATVSAAGVVTGIATGYVTLRYTVTNVCGVAEADKQIIVKDCGVTGVGSISAPAFSIFPNPASSLLNVQWAGITGKNASVQMTDVTGRVVLSSQLLISNPSGISQLDVTNLNDGMYMLSIISDGMYYTSKIAISRK